MEILTLPSPAKINLFLHITGQRNDGYHELQTAFQFLDYADDMVFKKTDSNNIDFQSDNLDLSENENLITRAASLLKTQTNTSQGADISINKRIPLGSGLGGGSSNAATTLLALNKLWNTRLTTAELAELGLKLGADVPIFIHGYAAWAEGVGEKITPIEPPESWILAINPPCHVPTAEIFRHENLTRNTTKITIRDFLSSGGQNDCEALTRKLYPAVDTAMNWLNAHASARMSGTGSSVYAEFANRDEAEQLLSQIPDSFSGFVAKTMNQSPLHSVLQQN